MCGSGKRLIPIAAVVLAATAALLGPVPEAVDASFGRGTTEHKVIARDDKSFGLWAVGDTVLYGRSAKRRRWMRVVDGRRLTAHLPAGAFVTSVGRDPAGRVVAVVGTSARSSIYDVASDVRRPVPVSDRPGCVVTSVSVWRTRLVYYNVCRGVILRDGTRETSVGALSYDNEPPQLFLRGRSLAADGIARDESHRVWRILDHGRRCRAVVDSIDPVDDWSRRAVTISRNELRWALAVDTALPGDGGNEIHKTDLTVMSVALSGGCDAPPTQRLVALDVTRKPIRAYALDGAFLLYATDSAIRRVRLQSSRVLWCSS